MNEIVQFLFDRLMIGDGSVVTIENIKKINDIALDLYNIPALNKDQIEDLRKIIMICNLLYNRTDMQVLPIEDGFYDLLLEKYKTYDPHFQVGSAIIDVRNLLENDPVNPVKIAECPIFFEKKVEKDEVHQSVFDEIMRKGKPMLSAEDFSENPIYYIDNNISKRTHDTKHNHPELVGTLDKCKFVLNKDAIDAGVFDDPNVKVLERDFFQDHVKKGIIDPTKEIEVVAELKYDGISVEADCNLQVQSARTRGDTGLGQASDITPLLKGYSFKHAECMIGEDPIGVKFEAIITKSALNKFNEIRGKAYRNCRTAIVGLFGASDAYLYRDLITLVPLAIDRKDVPQIQNRIEEIEFLNKVFVSNGEPLRYCYFKGTLPRILYLIKVFWDEAKLARDKLDFMYDGIVISYLDENIRARLGRENYINKFSMAVKFDPLEKQTIFRGYSYTVGQNGQITPMIHYDPVEFLGTIHDKSTGSSLARFKDLSLKYGDYISITYNNDVMPYVSRMDCEHNKNNPNPVVPIIDKCPICGTKLVESSSGKLIMCPNTECPGRSLQRMVNMFDKLNIKGFADSAFSILMKDYNITHLYELYNISRDQYITSLGVADGNNIFDALVNLKTTPIHDYIVMGSLGFTSLAQKKWAGVLQQIKLKDIQNHYDSGDLTSILDSLQGIGPTTIETILNEYEFFKSDIQFIVDNFNLIDSYGQSTAGKIQIRFSGCRNKQLCEQLNTKDNIDADDDGSVTKNTDILLVLNEGFDSSKIQKARKYGTMIIPIEDFMQDIDGYLSQIHK